jgi:hypothetical protein
VPYPMEMPSWLPNIPISLAKENVEKLLHFKSELGQKALDTLRSDFAKTDEGFPVPETYYLVNILGELYKASKQYEQCENLVATESVFDEQFWNWPLEELLQTNNWLLSYVTHAENASFARGILQRPDYKEFLDQLKKNEERYQKQELQHIRLEERIKNISSRNTHEDFGNKLLNQYPWLKKASNTGSLITGEFLYEQLKIRSWGEVVSGYCNAVEEELKQYLSQEYLNCVYQLDATTYFQESQRRNSQGSLGLIANLSLEPMLNIYNRFWTPFVTKMYPKDKDFLVILPKALSDFTALRRPSVHGKMIDSTNAEKARDIVMGTVMRPGLLKRLIELRTEA